MDSRLPASRAGSRKTPQKDMNSDVNLNLFELFTSLQGESSYAGMPFVFVRLAGCNLDCAWCDTPKSRSFESGQPVALEKLLERIRCEQIRYVCITGGEPLVQPVAVELMRRLIAEGFTVTLETNGSVDISECPEGVVRVVDIKCPSSGMERMNRIENYALLRSRDEIKCVIADRVDYEYARKMISVHLAGFKGPVFFSPVAGRIEPPMLAKWMISDKIPARLQLQLHKIIGIS